MKNFLLLLFLFQGVLMSGVIDKVKINEIEVPIVFEKDSNLPISSFKFVFKGSGYLSDGLLDGISHLSARILDEGTKKLGSVEFAKKLENEAIDIYIEYNKETLSINVSCLKEKSSDAIKAINELLMDPNFTEDTLDKIKTLTIGEITTNESDYDYVAARNLNKLLFTNTPLEKDGLGTIESVKKISLQDVKAFIQNNLVLKNLIIVAGGDIELDEVKKLSSKAVKSLQIGEEKKIDFIETSKDVKEKIVNIKNIQQSYIYFGSRYNLKYNDKDIYKASVANFILGSSGFGSRLMEEIRVKRGLAYSVYSRASFEKSYSAFLGYMQTKPENQDKSIKMIKELINNFVKNGANEEEFNGAKKFLLGSEALGNETISQRIAKSFGEYYKGFKLGYTKEVLEKIKNLKLEDLNNFIKSHPEILNLSFSIVTK